MPPTERSRITMSGRPARRRPGCRHLATTVSFDATNRLPGGHSVPPSSRRPITAPPGTLRRVEERGRDLTLRRSWDLVDPAASEIPDQRLICP
jgi:hypothetical protein